MRIGGQHLGDAEGRELIRRILDTLDLKADIVERFEDRRQVGIRVKMRLEPAQRELHAPTPPLSVGTSRPMKP